LHRLFNGFCAEADEQQDRNENDDERKNGQPVLRHFNRRADLFGHDRRQLDGCGKTYKNGNKREQSYNKSFREPFVDR